MDKDPEAPSNEPVEETPRSVHRHDLEPMSLTFGVLFALLGLTFLFGDVDAADLGAGWIWAGMLGMLGLALLGLALRRRWG